MNSLGNDLRRNLESRTYFYRDCIYKAFLIIAAHRPIHLDLRGEGRDFRCKGGFRHQQPSSELIGMLLKPVQILSTKIFVKMFPIFHSPEITFLNFSFMENQVADLMRIGKAEAVFFPRIEINIPVNTDALQIPGQESINILIRIKESEDRDRNKPKGDFNYFYDGHGKQIARGYIFFAKLIGLLPDIWKA